MLLRRDWSLSMQSSTPDLQKATISGIHKSGGQVQLIIELKKMKKSSFVWSLSRLIFWKARFKLWIPKDCQLSGYRKGYLSSEWIGDLDWVLVRMDETSYLGFPLGRSIPMPLAQSLVVRRSNPRVVQAKIKQWGENEKSPARLSPLAIPFLDEQIEAGSVCPSRDPGSSEWVRWYNAAKTLPTWDWSWDWTCPRSQTPSSKCLPNGSIWVSFTQERVGRVLDCRMNPTSESALWGPCAVPEEERGDTPTVYWLQGLEESEGSKLPS